MKKFSLIIIVLVLSAFNLVGVLSPSILADEEGKLGCSSLTGCGSSASCSGRGTATGCNITCEDGSFVGCPKASEND